MKNDIDHLFLNGLLRDLLSDYLVKPRECKKHTILTILKLCPLFIKTDSFLITEEIKENNKYKHYYPIYTNISLEDIKKGEYDIKSSLDIVNFIKFNNKYNKKYKIDGIIINLSNKVNLTFSIDELCCSRYENYYSIIKNITWLKDRPLIKIDKAINNYLSKFDNKLIEDTKIGNNHKYIDLDINKGGITIIGARPSMGKTQVAVNAAINEVMNNNGSVLYISNEYSMDKLVERFISELSYVGIIRTSKITDKIYSKMVLSIKELMNKKIYLKSSLFNNIKEIEETIKDSLKIFKPTMIVIDNLQFIGVNNDRFDNENSAFVINRLKRLAKEIDAKMIVLSQLNRKLENRKDKHPVIADIKDLAKTDKYVNKIYMLYSDDYYDKNNKEIWDLEINEVYPTNNKETKEYKFNRRLCFIK